MITSVRSPQVPFDNTYWVKPQKFLAGCYPGTPSPKLIPERITALLNTGIETIISLMQDNETYSDGSPYAHYEQEFFRQASQLGKKATYLNFPIPDFGLPDNNLLDSILTAINEALDENSPVFVHCWGGKGRTGTVTGCWLAQQGETNPLERLQILRRNCPNGKEPSPETEAQRQMVLSFINKSKQENSC